MTNALEIKKKTPWGGGNATYHEIRNMNFEYKRGERKKGKEFINSKDSRKKKKEFKDGRRKISKVKLIRGEIEEFLSGLDANTNSARISTLWINFERIIVK